MYKKTATYTDYNGVERTEDYLFNLTKAELTMMNMSAVGGLQVQMQKMIDRQDGAAIMKFMKDILRRSYGEKSDDGRRFIKSEQLSDEFEQTEAYSDIFIQLCTDAKFASEFVNGILPADLNPNATALPAGPVPTK